MINFPVSDWMPDANIPSGPIQDKWSKYKLEAKLINPNNRRKYTQQPAQNRGAGRLRP